MVSFGYLLRRYPLGVLIFWLTTFAWHLEV